MQKLEQQLTKFVEDQNEQLSNIHSRIDDAMTILDAIKRKEPLSEEQFKYYQAIAEATPSMMLRKLILCFIQTKRSEQ